MKKKLTYFILSFCLAGLFCTAFYSTFKVLKQSILTFEFNIEEIDIEEDNECEKKEISEKDLIPFQRIYIQGLLLTYTNKHLTSIEAKLVAMYTNIESPPPKI